MFNIIKKIILIIIFINNIVILNIKILIKNIIKFLIFVIINI